MKGFNAAIDKHHIENMFYGGAFYGILFFPL